MKVLVVLPERSCLPQAERAWRTGDAASDELTVLVCSGAGTEERAGHTVHTLDHELAIRERWRKTLGAVLAHLPPVERTFWRCGAYLAFLGAIWPSLLFHIRSFDPDLIDLRWMAGSRFLKARLSRFPQLVALAKGETPPEGRGRADWRRYDPNAKVSIILPVFNGDRYLRESIESCLGQTHRDLELIIVDDGSTDGTPGIIAEYARNDPRIVPIRNAKNLRLPGALNVGFSRATGDLLTWTSCDNNFAPGAIEALVAYLCTWPDIDFVYSATRHIDEFGRVVEKAVYRRPPWLLGQYNVMGSYYLYRRRVYEELGNFRTDMEYVEDYEYWVRVYLRFPVMRLSLPLYDYRVHPESMTARIKHLQLSGELRDHVRRRYFTRSGEPSQPGT